MDVVLGRGHDAAVEHLQRWTVVTTIVCASTSPASAATASSRSLKPPPLPKARAGLVDRDATGDDEVDGFELVDVDRAARCATRP